MLQGHTVDALLATAYRDAPLFQAWSFTRGLTSSTFLFVGGFAFSVVTARGWNAAAGRAGTWRRLRRFLFFIALGYALHYPAANLAAALAMPAVAWRPLLAVDVLQCIAVTLAVLQLLVVCTRTPRRFFVATLLLCAAVAGLTPMAWQLAPGLPLPTAITAYLAPSTGSIFPLFPFAAYGAIGAAMGMLYASSHTPAAATRALRTIGPAGVAMCAAALLFRAAGWEPAGGVDLGAARPSQFLLQAGLVCVLITVLAAAARPFAHRSPPVIALAQESLTIYFVHVCLVYGSPWNPGLRQLFGPTLSLPAVIGCVLAMWALMALLSVAWNRYKHHEPARAAQVRLAVVGALLVLLAI